MITCGGLTSNHCRANFLFPYFSLQNVRVLNEKLITVFHINDFEYVQVRKLEFHMADAVKQECKHVITCGGLTSNHCRATAVAVAQCGLKCHLVLTTKITVSILNDFKPVRYTFCTISMKN